MKKQKKHIILYPFAVIYGLITAFRNWLYDQEILRSTRFEIPVISIGNLAVGGTGKTPHTEFLISHLQQDWNLAMLSRGYKRKTKGFILADQNSDAQSIGDEPYQIFSKYPNAHVAVDEKRVRGIKSLQSLIPDLQLILLDDAFQHRSVQPGFSILLTDYSNLYTSDWMLPAGSLREWRSGSKRANVIIVTKCPNHITPIDMRVATTLIKPETNQLLFFSTLVYDEIKPVFPETLPENWTTASIETNKAEVLFVSGIANNQPIEEHFSKLGGRFNLLSYGDHYNFQPKDFNTIQKTFDALSSEQKVLLVTEKDAARLVSNPQFPTELKTKTYCLPIRIEILQQQETLLLQKIQNYVTENSRNS